MVGSVLLFFSFFLYFSQRKWSILILLVFIGGGFSLISLGAKGEDLTFIFLFPIVLYSITNERRCENEDFLLSRLVTILVLFLLLSMLFSLFYYNFTLFQVIQGGRHLFNFIGYYFLIKTLKKDIFWILDKLYLLTLLTSVLYIIQVLTGLPVLLYGEVSIDQSTGIGRYYNSPFYLPLYIYIIALQPGLIRRKGKTVSLLILIVAQICTLGRAEIATVIGVVLLGLVLKGNFSRFSRIIVVGAVVSIPLIDVVSARFGGEKSSSDMEAIMNGEYKNKRENHIQGGTMNYRFAWIYERWSYLKERPFIEMAFGLGMISDSQSQVVLRKYRFFNGLPNKETGQPTQLWTPDIAYGNLLTQFGIVGGIIILSIWIYLMCQAFKRRNENAYAFILFLLLLGYFIRSMSGSVISTPSSLLIPFLIYSLFYKPQKHENNSYRVRSWEPDVILLRATGIKKRES